MRPEQVAEGLSLFVESELLPAFDGWRMWAAAAALALFHKQSGSIITTLSQNKIISSLGVVDGDGNIDVDSAIEALKEALRKHGKLPLDIPALDISFNFSENDVETLRGYLNQVAGE